MDFEEEKTLALNWDNVSTVTSASTKTLAPGSDNVNSAALDFELEKDISFGNDKASTVDIDFEL